MIPLDRTWPLAEAVQLACMLEASAPKLGNVHPGASFHDMHFGHFVASSMAIRQPFQRISQAADTRASYSGVGKVVLAACQATKEHVGCNTNLGTLLLFAPLAIAFHSGASNCVDLQTQIVCVLDALTIDDSRLVYEAIRVAQPGGLGKRESQDVADSPPGDLKAAMGQVADVDAVARQYVNQFEDIFERLLPWLNEALVACNDANNTGPLDAICRLQIRWLAHEPDGLIVRKLGIEIAKEVQKRAQSVWQQLQGFTGEVAELQSACELDLFLREDGNRRNPGTTADLIAATLLVKLLLG